MSRTISLVQRVEIASPCTVSWDTMVGDDKVRFCGECKLNVYNLSAMTQEEGEQLIIEKEGKLCARVYRRRDGTILTRDCPVGLAALRRRIVGFGVAIAATLLFAVGSALSAIVGTRDRESDPIKLIQSNAQPSVFHTVSTTVSRWLNTTPPPRPPANWTAGVVIARPPVTPAANTPPATKRPRS